MVGRLCNKIRRFDVTTHNKNLGQYQGDEVVWRKTQKNIYSYLFIYCLKYSENVAREWTLGNQKMS